VKTLESESCQTVASNLLFRLYPGKIQEERTEKWAFARVRGPDFPSPCEPLGKRSRFPLGIKETGQEGDQKRRLGGLLWLSCAIRMEGKMGYETLLIGRKRTWI
jgi:hypothetical protein